MARTITKTIYTLDELSPRAKERARDWFREGDLNDVWWDELYEQAVAVAAILGITISEKRQSGREAPTEPAIFFCGFSVQGQGARFEGQYAYRAGCARLIRRHQENPYHYDDKALHLLADRLLAVQKKYKFSASAVISLSGRGEHELCTDIHCRYLTARGHDPMFPEDEEELKDILRGFMRWIFDQLHAEYQNRISDEYVDETILANEYTFDEAGNREG